MTQWALPLILLTACRICAAHPESNAEEVERAARWQELQHALFAGRSIQDGSAWMGIEAPARALVTSAGPPAPTADAARPRLLVLDLELTGDLGGPEFTAEHEARLVLESSRLRADLERTNRYHIMDSTQAQPALDRLRSQQAYLHDCNGCDLEVARQVGADLVFVAWVDRVSGLILSLTYEIHDVQTGQIAARQSFDFRGDNDNAWNHAIDYMVRHLEGGQSGAAAPDSG
jgi:hypothetical protein